MASKPTQRTLAVLRKDGYTCHIAEKWNAFARIRQDFGGFADILAYKPGVPGVFAIQTCADSGDVQKRVIKLMALENVRIWLLAENRVEIWGWGLRGPRGMKKEWTLRAVPITLESFAQKILEPEEVEPAEPDSRTLPF
jgi:hypothetical protein